MTEVRELSKFHSVDLRSLGRVVLASGPEQKVEVEAEEDLQSRVRTEVQGGVLMIGLRWWLGALLRVPELADVVVRVTVPELREIRLSGAGQVRSEGPLRVGDLDLRLSGAGRLLLELTAERVLARLSGAGAVDLSGTAGELEIRLSGAGAVQAERLETRRVRIRASGAGECRVQASETLEAEVSGAGSVRYRGNPRIDSRITGVGRLAPID
ncbi:MAG: hypothetical protein A2V99_08535 [Spirochaetes bacterium RBG_16_67_19]|nr:MAG: hypothetical protein A2064_09955 [Spirochaetes bacterium GWB1_66_5]OHD74523.1 MAG: hypothetical protein A2V99_08535 [Spirochaetes bacterium RBG_16_67_19]